MSKFDKVLEALINQAKDSGYMQKVHEDEIEVRDEALGLFADEIDDLETQVLEGLYREQRRKRITRLQGRHITRLQAQMKSLDQSLHAGAAYQEDLHGQIADLLSESQMDEEIMIDIGGQLAFSQEKHRRATKHVERFKFLKRERRKQPKKQKPKRRSKRGKKKDKEVKLATPAIIRPKS